MGDVAFKSLLHDFYNKYAEGSATVEIFEAACRATRASLCQSRPAASGAAWLLRAVAQFHWRSRFHHGYVIYRPTRVFARSARSSSPWIPFHMPVDLRIDTEGNPENKTIDVIGTESEFTVETFGRPKPGGIKIDPNNLV